MRPMRTPPLVLASLFLSTVALCQQVASPGSAPAPLQQSLASLAGGSGLTDVMLTGTVRRVAGSDDETGTAIFQALASGETRIDLSFSSGLRSEVYALGPQGPVGQWSGPDQRAHAIANHNLMVDPAWFCPALVMQRANGSGSGMVVASLGTATSAGHPLDHLRIASPPPNSTADKSLNAVTKKVADAFRAAPQIDFYLDPATHLPVEMDFNTHPDSNLGQNIPVRVKYSDYRVVNGVQVPFHLQKFLNNSLVLDIQLDSASFNSGLAATSFVVTAEASRRLAQ